MNEIIPEKVIAFSREVLQRHHHDKSAIIAMLQEIQEEYHYLPELALNELTRGLNVSPQSVYGVATFYAQFSLNPKGKYLVKICDGTACHVKNAAVIYNKLAKKFNFAPGKITTSDGLFTLETVACLGACGIAPVMVINETVYPQVDPDHAVAVIDMLIKDEKELVEAK